MKIWLYSFLCCFLLYAAKGIAQKVEIPFSTISLQNFSQFQPSPKNWHLASTIFFDPLQAGKGKVIPGTGTLVNLPDKKNNGNLFTNMEHGDIELELEFMMDKGSNAGVYLQGRYEVQIFDSWGVVNPRFSDAGGIYQCWDTNRGTGREGFEGHPPRVNASKAPGLWQHFRIVFRAPRFDKQGHKTTNARFVQVVYNGVTVQENVEVSGPTRSASFTDEKPLGPLMLQGDHGPVAFRNIRYKTYGQQQVQVQNLQYRTYDGQFGQLPDFASLTPVQQGQSPVLLHYAGQSDDLFAGQYTGTIRVPVKGTYLFDLYLGWITADPHFRDHKMGAGRLVIGDQIIVNHPGRENSAGGLVELEAGEHPFTLSYFKNRGGQGQSFVLYAEGPGVERQKLATPVAQTPPTPPGAILVSAEREPVILRSFVNHQGLKRTHCVSVADPSGAHYSLDLQQGALLQVWKGDFAETTTMWHGRGDAQLAEPLGSVIELSGQPKLAQLSSPGATWPDSVTPGSFRFKGYHLDAQGQPSFNYQWGEVQVQERLMPTEHGRQLQHELTFTGTGKNIWCRLAEGSNIVRLKDNSYSVNDQQYYVMVPKSRKAARPQIRKVNGREELLLPVPLEGGSSSLRYSIMW